MVLINELELATELASKATIDELIASGKINDESEAFVQETEDMTRYTDEAQDVFNRWYDYYYDVIMKVVD